MIRLWAGSADYHADVRCSDNIFKQLSQSYLKFRNTARYCLGNLDVAVAMGHGLPDLVAGESQDRSENLSHGVQDQPQGRLGTAAGRKLDVTL